MFALVEPMMFENLVDRPHLGCAMLIGECEAQGIPTRLVKGQTWYLRRMFIEDSEELWHLISDLVRRNNLLPAWHERIKKLDLEQFQSTLKDLYTGFFLNKEPRRYLTSAGKVKELQDWRVFLLFVHRYFLACGEESRLGFLDRYLAEILRHNPRFVGFSIQSHFDEFTRALRRRIKQETGIPVIVGGSFTPSIDRAKFEGLFEDELIDYLVVGPGDHALPALLEALDENREPAGIPNVFYIKNGQVKGGDLKPVEDLNALPPPDYSQFDLDLYPVPRRVLSLQTSRGCSWNRCAFCEYTCSSAFGTYRMWRAENVVDTLEHLHRTYQCSFFSFNDDEIPPGRARKLCREIVDRNLEGAFNIVFWGTRFARGYNNDDLLRLMSRAGVRFIGWGLESGSQRVVDRMNKGISVSTAGEILEKSAAQGISNECYIFFGFPGETKAEAEQTVDFLKQHHNAIDFITYSAFSLIPTSRLGQNPEEWGVHVAEDGRYLPPEGGMSASEAEAFTKSFHNRFTLDRVNLSSGKMKYCFHSYLNETLFFLLASYKLLPLDRIKILLDQKQWQSLFPLVGGTVVRRDDQAILMPLNFQETVLVNQVRPPGPVPLDPVEEKLVAGSDGRSSVDQIVRSLEEWAGVDSRTAVEQKAQRFYDQIFSNHWALGFGRSWQDEGTGVQPDRFTQPLHPPVDPPR